MFYDKNKIVQQTTVSCSNYIKYSPFITLKTPVTGTSCKFFNGFFDGNALTSVTSWPFSIKPRTKEEPTIKCDFAEKCKTTKKLYDSTGSKQQKLHKNIVNIFRDCKRMTYFLDQPMFSTTYDKLKIIKSILFFN